MLELSEHGIVLIVEESSCLQAKVYLKREVPISSFDSVTIYCFFFLSAFQWSVCGVYLQLFLRYDYKSRGRPRFGVSLGHFVDCLNAFSLPGQSSVIQIQYPGPDMQLLLKCVTNYSLSFFFFFFHS